MIAREFAFSVVFEKCDRAVRTHPHRTLFTFIDNRFVLDEAERVFDERLLFGSADIRCFALKHERIAGRRERFEPGRMNFGSVSHPPVTMAQPEHIVRVNERDHARHVDHEATRNVTRMSDRMGSLLAGEGELVRRWYSGADEVAFAIDFQHFIDEKATGAVRAIGDKFGIERHRARSMKNPDDQCQRI